MLPHRSSSSGSAVRGRNSELTAAASGAPPATTLSKVTRLSADPKGCPTIRCGWIDHVARDDQELQVEQGSANVSGERFRAPYIGTVAVLSS